MYDGTRYLVLFVCEKDGFIYNRIRYVTSVKSDIRYVISHNYPKIKVYSCDSLLLEKTLIFHKVIQLIKSVFNKNQNRYYYNIFFKKGLYQSPKKMVVNKFLYKL